MSIQDKIKSKMKNSNIQLSAALLGVAAFLFFAMLSVATNGSILSSLNWLLVSILPAAALIPILIFASFGCATLGSFFLFKGVTDEDNDYSFDEAPLSSNYINIDLYNKFKKRSEYFDQERKRLQLQIKLKAEIDVELEKLNSAFQKAKERQEFFPPQKNKLGFDRPHNDTHKLDLFSFEQVGLKCSASLMPTDELLEKIKTLTQKVNLLFSKENLSKEEVPVDDNRKGMRV